MEVVGYSLSLVISVSVFVVVNVRETGEHELHRTESELASCAWLFMAPKKQNHLKPSTFGSIFPTLPRRRSNSPLPVQRE